MITIRTRSSAKDYDNFFGRSEVFWDSYKALHKENTQFCVFVELDGRDWKAFFSKIPSERKSQMGQPIYVELTGKGQKGDEDALRFYNLISYALKDPIHIEKGLTDISKKCDSVFDAAFIDSLDGKRHTAEAEKMLAEKMQVFFKNFEGEKVPSVPSGNGQKARTVHVDCLTPSSKEMFLSNVSRICSTENREEMVLVCTFKPLSFAEINSFCTQFSGKELPISILVESVGSLKLPYTADIAQSVLNSGNSKKKLLKIWLGHLLVEFLMLSLLVLGVIMVLRKNAKLEQGKTQNETLHQDLQRVSEEKKALEEKVQELSRLQALQGRWASFQNEGEEPVSLFISGEAFALSGLTNYAIVGKIDKDSGLLKGTGKVHTIAQLAQEGDSKEEELEAQLLRNFSQKDGYIEVVKNSDGETVRLYKQENE